MESCLQAWVRNSRSDSKEVISWKHILHLLTLCYNIQTCICHDFTQNGGWKPLLSFFHLPKCLLSHPPITTHLCLGFLLSPTVFKTIPTSTFPLLSPPKSSRFYSPLNAGGQAQGILSLMQRAVFADRFIDYRLRVNKISQLSTAMAYQGT